MGPMVREFTNETELMSVVNLLSSQGVSKENLYVLTHDSDRTNRLAEKTDASEIGLKEMGLGKAVEQIFRSEGDQLRMKMEELGLSEQEVERYERKLDQGKILLIVNEN